jgi:hypothetical protein
MSKRTFSAFLPQKITTKTTYIYNDVKKKDEQVF